MREDWLAWRMSYDRVIQICLFPKDIVLHAVFAFGREIKSLPCKIVIGKSAANTLVIKDINPMLTQLAGRSRSEWYGTNLNRLIEQVPRFIKCRVNAGLQELGIGFRTYDPSACHAGRLSLTRSQAMVRW